MARYKWHILLLLLVLKITINIIRQLWADVARLVTFFYALWFQDVSIILIVAKYQLDVFLEITNSLECSYDSTELVVNLDVRDITYHCIISITVTVKHQKAEDIFDVNYNLIKNLQPEIAGETFQRISCVLFFLHKKKKTLSSNWYRIYPRKTESLFLLNVTCNVTEIVAKYSFKFCSTFSPCSLSVLIVSWIYRLFKWLSNTVAVMCFPCRVTRRCRGREMTGGRPMKRISLRMTLVTLVARTLSARYV